MQLMAGWNNTHSPSNTSKKRKGRAITLTNLVEPLLWQAHLDLEVAGVPGLKCPEPLGSLRFRVETVGRVTKSMDDAELNAAALGKWLIHYSSPQRRDTNIHSSNGEQEDQVLEQYPAGLTVSMAEFLEFRRKRFDKLLHIGSSAYHEFNVWAEKMSST